MPESPEQTQNSDDIVTGMKEILENNFFLIETDMRMVCIAANNVRYIQVYPAPRTSKPGARLLIMLDHQK